MEGPRKTPESKEEKNGEGIDRAPDWRVPELPRNIMPGLTIQDDRRLPASRPELLAPDVREIRLARAVGGAVGGDEELRSAGIHGYSSSW